MKVLITGSSGQLGSYVAELMQKENRILGLDIRPQLFDPLKNSSMIGDVCSRESVRSALKGVEAVVHCAAQVSVVKATEDPISDAATNVLGTVNMLHESELAGVSKFVYISSAAVFGNPKYIPIDESHPTDPMNNYGASKLSGEKYARAYSKTSKMTIVCVRPFNFYSPRADPESPYSGVITRFVSRLKQGLPPIIEGDGRQTRDFIHAHDVARMIKLVLEKNVASGEMFNCGSGVSTSILSLAENAISVSGVRVSPAFTSPRKGDIRDSLADSKKVRGVLGFDTQVTLRDGLAELFR